MTADEAVAQRREMHEWLVVDELEAHVRDDVQLLARPGDLWLVAVQDCAVRLFLDLAPGWVSRYVWRPEDTGAVMAHLERRKDAHR